MLSKVVEDAAAEYLTYFAGKVVGMIRAPDDYAYPAPFNIIEIIFVAPFEFFVSEATYARINRYVMLVVFFIPLSIIAVYEAELDPAKNKWVKDWLSHPDEGDEDNERHQNPEAGSEDAEHGLEISKVLFEDIVKVFPDTTQSSEAVILREIRQLKGQVEELKKLLTEKTDKRNM
ncbi:hypothetical protein AcW1_004936 [Taiwanofungus camphoratus]|nr:hypothetical protein AcW1_004936 [Antrodia cinnamomea]